MLETLVPDDHLAELAPRFEVLKILGYGGMGLCYLAEDKFKRERCALKVIHPDLSDNQEALWQLKREAQFEQALQRQPHIIHTYELLEYQRCTAKVMQVLTGMTLKEYLLNAREVNRVMLREQIAQAMYSALHVSHQRGILHGDIKPANIFMGDRGEITLFDFGVARYVIESIPFNFSAYSGRYTSPRVQEGAAPTIADDYYSLEQVLAEVYS